MDWISKLEKEKNEEEQAKKRNKKEKAEKLQKEESTFALVKEKLCPVIKSTIAALDSRVGIKLVLHEHTTSIEVTRDPNHSRVINPHRLVISNLSTNAESVLVKAIQARQVHRPELDNIDKSDWTGEKFDEVYRRDVTIVEAHVDLTDLLANDLQFLLEWLSRTDSYDGGFVTPQIIALRTKNEKKEAYTNDGQKNSEKSSLLKKVTLCTGIVAVIFVATVPTLRKIFPDSTGTIWSQIVQTDLLTIVFFVGLGYISVIAVLKTIASILELL